MKKYQTYLFDWDGCLINTLPHVLDSYTFAFKQFQLYPTKEDIIKKSFGNWKGPIKSGLNENQLEDFDQILLEDIKNKRPLFSLHKNVDKVLKTLKINSSKIALVSTAIKPSIEPMLNKFKLSGYFDLIITKNDVKNHKPNPEELLFAMAKLHSDPDFTVMIGDSPHDIKAGQNTGIDTIAFYPNENKGFYKKTELTSLKPTHIIHDLIELIN